MSVIVMGSPTKPPQTKRTPPLQRQLESLRKLKDASLLLKNTQEEVLEQIRKIERQAEAERDALLVRCRQMATECAGSADKHGNLIQTADWWLEALQWRQDQISGLNWYRAVAPEDRARFSATYFQAIEKRSGFDVQFSCLDNSNRRLAVHYIGCPTYTLTGEFSGHCAFIWQV